MFLRTVLQRRRIDLQVLGLFLFAARAAKQAQQTPRARLTRGRGMCLKAADRCTSFQTGRLASCSSRDQGVIAKPRQRLSDLNKQNIGSS